MQGLSDTLYEPPMNLSLDQQRIDHVATIVHRHVLGDFGLPCLSVDLHDTDVSAEGKGKVRWLEETRHIQSRFDAGRKVHSVVGRSHNVVELDGSSRVTFHHELSDPEFDPVWLRFQQMCCYLLHLFFQVLHSKIYSRSSNRSAAASEGTDTCSDACGVTVQCDNIIRFQAELVGDNLCECCFLSLAVGRRASQDGDLTRALDTDSTGFPAAPG